MSVALLLSLFLIIPQGAIAEYPMRTQAERALGNTRGAPRFSDYPVPTNLKSRQGWLSVGRCDQAFGTAYDKLARREAAGQRARFAGRYILVICSCGTGCGNLSIVELKTGRVRSPLFGPLTEHTCAAQATANYSDFLYFRADSSLLIAVRDISRFSSNGEEKGSGCAIRYYHWTGRRLVLLKKVVLA